MKEEMPAIAPPTLISDGELRIRSQSVVYADVFRLYESPEGSNTRITEIRHGQSLQPHGHGIRILIDSKCDKDDALALLKLYVEHVSEHGWDKDAFHKTEPLGDDELEAMLMGDSPKQAISALEALRRRKGIHDNTLQEMDEDIPF